tara:strand:+ start:280 stop:660 length:381 start_codon:yes stop_codon:yes gene_type:complete
MTKKSDLKKILIPKLSYLFFLILYIAIPANGFTQELKDNQVIGKTAKARVAVEQAWETYHDAALGGTLASPEIQTKLEMNLHKSRALLAEAYDAEDRGDMETVNKMIREIMQIKHEVITESREQKR